MVFSNIAWSKLSPEEKEHLESLSEEELKNRWNTKEGKDKIRKIVRVNLNYGKSQEYSEFLGTIVNLSGEERFDLRGINFADFSNIINDEVFSFDFSNCDLKYSDFSRSSFSHSKFYNAHILYSDFSFGMIDHCNFANTNMTLSHFTNSTLEGSDLRGSWLSDVDFSGSNLGFVKFNNQTDFQNIDVNCFEGTSNPLFLSFIKRKHYLKHFKDQSNTNAVKYYIWWLISDCGQSFFRWFLTSIFIIIVFGYVFTFNQNAFIIANNRTPTGFTFYYYSIVAFTTLGFGDIVPNNIVGEILISIEVVLGYLMLGGLLSIFANKFVPKY